MQIDRQRYVKCDLAWTLLVVLTVIMLVACATTPPAGEPTPQASGNMRDPRFAATATVLADGRVLIAGVSPTRGQPASRPSFTTLQAAVSCSREEC
jgi:hypothetical protein